jgi:hypothetical protein
MPLIALALAAGISQLNFDIVDIKTENRQPSEILGKLKGYTASDSRVFAVDNASLIRIWATKSETSRIKSFIKLMDVPPQYINISATALNRVTKITSGFEVKTSNGSVVGLSDSSSNATFTLTPLVRQDGLIRVALIIKCGNYETTNIFVCKPNKSYEFMLGPKMVDSMGNDTPESTYVMRVKVSLPAGKR